LTEQGHFHEQLLIAFGGGHVDQCHNGHLGHKNIARHRRARGYSNVPQW
jgi:hypothetical protein